jgi:hypothetical protein
VEQFLRELEADGLLTLEAPVPRQSNCGPC